MSQQVKKHGQERVIYQTYSTRRGETLSSPTKKFFSNSALKLLKVANPMAVSFLALATRLCSWACNDLMSSSMEIVDRSLDSSIATIIPGGKLTDTVG